MAESATSSENRIRHKKMMLQQKTRARYIKAHGVAWAAIALLVLCESLPAQESAPDSESSATLAETIAWLRSTINNQVLVDASAPGRLDVICRNSLSFRDGILRLKNTCSGPTKTSYTSWSVPLAAVDPLTIKVTHELFWAVRFSTRMSKPVISWDGDGTDDPTLFKPSEGFFLFNDKEIALRVSRALKHAVKLSGGKVDPF